MDIHKPPISFELFPPKTLSGMAKLKATWQQLNSLGPSYFSVTFGAGGSTQAKTVEIVDALCAQGIRVAPHISCIGISRSRIRQLLQHYINSGINDLVVIRGDLPVDIQSHDGDFQHANELVSFIREQTEDRFHINVAAYPEVHPQAANGLVDLENFKRKVDAGANYAITQYFFDANAYFHFVDSCRKAGVQIPIIPGIMPISNYAKLCRFSKACQADLPLWLHKRMESYADDPASIRAFGIEVVTKLCQDLLNNDAPGLHIYTLNQLEPTKTILQRLGLSEQTSTDHLEDQLSGQPTITQ